MRHPRVDLRKVHGEHVAEDMRLILFETQGDLIAQLPPPDAERRRVHLRSPEALDRRRHRGARLSV